MNVTNLLAPDRTDVLDNIASKKRLLEHVSELLGSSSPQVSRQSIFDALVNREKLGSTGLGNGVAIPHGRLPGLAGPVCALVRLVTPVDFDAADGQPVDLAFALLVPEESTEEHLQVLSTIAEIFSNKAICGLLRACDNGECLLNQLYQWERQRISA
jgi:PTS system nitrogen regulatory IIA component